ncbi:MAG: extracellular solute-binding protein [Paenibacillaceae bacterium]|nr:extracellular solute-binding protein [Paenibacillaceae bacterium]
MKKRVAIMVIVSIVLVTVLSACSKKQKTEESAKDAAPTRISILTPFFSKEPPNADNVIVKEVEKRTNTQLDITWAPSARYDDKVSVTMASGSMPDLLLALSPFTSQIRQLVDDGAFWDLTDKIKAYPNLAALPADIWNNTKMQDGRNYGIPRARSLTSVSIPIIRMDWLNKVNLPFPESLDDLYKVMVAFTKNDPDGNGKDDTYGLVGDWKSTMTWIFNVFTNTSFATTTNGLWKVEDGKMASAYTLPEMRDALVWFNKAYSEGLVPKDFINLVQYPAVQEMVSTGKAGIWADGTHEAVRVQLELNKTVPNAELRPMPYIVSPAGKKWAPIGGGFNGLFFIPKTVSEAKLNKILTFMDYGASDEGHDLGWYGLENVHYKVESGFKITTEQAVKDNVSQQAFGQIFGKYDKYQNAYFVGITPALYERNKKIVDQRLEIGISDPSVGLYSKTQQLVGSEIMKRIDDMMLKVVIGKEDIKAWDSFIAGLKADAQFQAIVQEFNDSYAKRVGSK